MRRKFLVGMILGGLVMAASVFAETDSKALAVIRDIQLGNRGINSIVDLNVEDDAHVRGDLDVDGTGSIAGVVTLDSAPVLTVQQAVTGTPVAAASVLLPEGASTNAAKLLKITIGTTNYVIAGWAVN